MILHASDRPVGGMSCELTMELSSLLPDGARIHITQATRLSHDLITLDEAAAREVAAALTAALDHLARQPAARGPRSRRRGMLARLAGLFAGRPAALHPAAST